MIDFTKPIETRDGRTIRILCTNRSGKFPIVGLLDEKEDLLSWHVDGYFYEDKESLLDLVNVPVRKILYGNVYLHGVCLHETLDDAKNSKCISLSGRIELLFENDKLVNVKVV